MMAALTDVSTVQQHSPRIAEVAVDTHLVTGERTVLSYAIPAKWNARIHPGQLVWVPLRKQFVLGLVTAVHQEAVPFKLRPVEALVEPEFKLNEMQLALVHWLARETASAVLAAAALFFPPGLTHQAIEYIRLLTENAAAISELTPIQQQLVQFLEERGEVSVAEARKTLGRSLTTVISRLEELDIIERTVQSEQRVPVPRAVRSLVLTDAGEQAEISAPRQKAVIDYLLRRRRLRTHDVDEDVPIADILRVTGVRHDVIRALMRKGWVEQRESPVIAQSVTHNTAVSMPTLNEEQASVWAEVQSALIAREAESFLLHGVTGSGKTEIYLRAVAWCLRENRTAIVLVPEIALATQIVRRFTERFPGQVAVLHSALPDAERYAAWQDVAAGERRVVIGPRSALFAPVTQVGLIVIDEEHEAAYKQDSEPRYHARTVAEYLAEQQRAVLLLGSATPAVETTYRAELGELHRLTLSSRVAPGNPRHFQGQPTRTLDLPAVQIVDMRLELHRGNTSLFSDRLLELLERTFDAHEQAILLLNRRGMATVVQCRSCGTVLMCPFCDIPLVFHQDRQRLLCHRCNYQQAPPTECPTCGGVLNYFGAGTQRVEAEARELFPHVRVLRWDQDSVRRQGGHQELLRRVEEREVDLVVGTQMVAKGLDLPLVNAIGVIHADSMLHLPDFRSGERTFQLLTQVAGRAGRRTPDGEVVVQSYSPDHYAIQAAARHDYAAFFAEEIDFRRNQRYPPFTRLIRYLYRHANETKCEIEADLMARELARHARQKNVAIDLLGPTPAFASRIRGQYQWQIVLRSGREALDYLLDGLPIRPGWRVDVDPLSLL